VTEIKNAQGDRLSVERDHDGNILRITSPHGHTVSIQHDSEGRITQAADDAGHWVKYEYDEHGSLKKAVDWSGATQRFRYDASFNMTSAHEITPAADGRPACQVTVRNWFDEKNRFAGQKVNNGQFASVKYRTASNGEIRGVDMHDDQGFTRFFFNDAGYETRKDFSRGKTTHWSLRRVRDPQTNAVVDFRLRCGASEVKLPVSSMAPSKTATPTYPCSLTSAPKSRASANRRPRTCRRLHRVKRQNPSGLRVACFVVLASGVVEF
jgi:YD repeat-containing protein